MSFYVLLLTIDRCWNEVTFQNVAELEELEYLKVVQAVDWEYKDQIESLQLKSVDVYYMEIPTEENLIMRLNKDCLMHLQRFLDPEDWMDFRECHSRFQTLEIIEFAIYSKPMTLGPWNANRSYYTRIGPLVWNLEIANVTEADVYELLPFFTNLKGLTLSSIELHTGRCLPWNRYVLSFSSTLVYLAIREPLEYSLWKNCPCLTELRSIKTFSCTDTFTDNLLLFLQRNQSNMQKLSIYFKNQTLNREVWHAIAQMHNLKELRIDVDCLVDIHGLPGGSLPLLEYFSVEGDNNFVKNLCLMGSLGRYSKYPIIRFREMTTIKELYAGLENHTVLGVIQSLPQLRILKTREKLDVDTIQEIRSYLKEANRKLQINCIQY